MPAYSPSLRCHRYQAIRLRDRHVPFIPRPGRFALGFASACLIVIAVACSGSTQQQVLQSDTQLMARQLNQYRTVTPPHFYLFSQDMVAMNAVMDARVAGKTTFSLFFNRGVPDPYFMCASRGYPIPGDTELTNPEQVVNGNYNGSSGYWGVTIPQIDPNGPYTSHATASTYVNCLAPDGTTYIKYAESDVNAFPFQVTWDYDHHIAVPVQGATPSFSVPYDEAKANQTPLNVITNSDGSYSIRNTQGTEVARVSNTPTGLNGTPTSR